MDDDSSLKVQKNFICDHCYGAFRSSYHLKRHILTHTGENLHIMPSPQAFLQFEDVGIVSLHPSEAPHAWIKLQKKHTHTTLNDFQY